MMEISVIIPAFNEEERLGSGADAVLKYLETRGLSHELIIVDDGSTDKTAEVAGLAAAGRGNVKILRNKTNTGKGFSVRRGVAEARGELILFSDADLSAPIEELEKLENALRGTNADIAVGSRALTDSEILRRQPFYRELMGKIFNKIARALTFSGIKDSQCGFKLFRREAAKKLFAASKINGFAFDAEIIFLAQKSGVKVVETPVRWLNSPKTRVRAMTDSAAMFAELLKIRFNWLAGKYG